MKGLLFLLTLAFLAVCVYSSAPLAGGWQRVRIDDLEVVAAANFAAQAIEARNSTTIDIVFIRRAWVQVVAGKNYRMGMKLNWGGKEQWRQVVVYEDLNGGYSLTKIRKVLPTTPCPACAVLAIIADSDACFGGPQDGCKCCTNTGHVMGANAGGAKKSKAVGKKPTGAKKSKGANNGKAVGKKSKAVAKKSKGANNGKAVGKKSKGANKGKGLGAVAPAGQQQREEAALAMRAPAAKKSKGANNGKAVGKKSKAAKASKAAPGQGLYHRCFPKKKKV